MAKIKKGGFSASRKKERSWRRLRPPRRFWAAALLALLWIVGLTRAWPQSSGPSSRNSETTLNAWETLFAEGRRISSEQKKDLEALRKELSGLKNGSQELTDLSARLSASNERLRTYNEQIAERMQERDEDLARSYEDIERLKKRRLRLALAVGIQGAALIGISVLKFALKK